MNGGLPAVTEPLELFSLEAEQALLGAILTNGDALAVAEQYVQPESFYIGVHRELFERFIAARDAGQSINFQLVRATLGPFGKQDLQGLTVGEYVARLAAEAVTVVNTP